MACSEQFGGDKVSMKYLVSCGVLVSALALAVGLSGCASSAVAQRAAQGAADSAEVADPVSRISPEQAQDVTILALGLVGTPYRYGGNTPESGFDCSGLIAHVYRTSGSLVSPRTVAKLRGWGQAVSADRVRSGDLVLFFQGAEASHAGIYVGAGRFVHAPSTGGEVRLDRLSSGYWSSQPVAFRRP
jgi:cell wall-associated NlpC family hydrolase